MAIITRTSSKTKRAKYLVRVWNPETDSWVNGGTWADLLLAREKENELKRKLRVPGALMNLEDGKKTTVAEYWEVWREDRRHKVSQGWRISQDQMFRDYVEKHLGHHKMADVTSPMVSRVLDRIRDSGRSAQMVKHVYSLLRSMFGDAQGYYQMIDENPVNPKFHRPKVPRAKRAFLTPAQSWRLLEVARTHEYLGPAVWVQILAGLRPEAMQALKWDAVLWDSNQLLICRAWKQKVGVMADYPKGKDWEYVPMVRELKSYLSDLWSKTNGDASAFVCQGPKGGMLSYDTYIRALKRLCTTAGVTEISPHEARHSCTELWVQAGASAEDLRRLLNHTDLSSTAGYIHRTEERLHAIGSLIAPGSLRVIEGGAPTQMQTQLCTNGRIVSEAQG